MTVPITSAFDASPEKRKAECPVCLETTECRVLLCGHVVCDGCWSRCRHAAMRGSEDLGDIDDSETKKERAKRNRLFNKKRGRDGESIYSDFVPRFAELAEEARDAEGLEHLRWELMVEHPGIWANEAVADIFRKFTINGLKVLLQVMESRKDEMEAVVDEVAAEAPSLCALLLAKAYDIFHNYRAAVPWAELSVHYALTRPAGSAHIRDAYAVASMVQAKADLLTRSLESFDACVGPEDDAGSTESARADIVRERNKWIGTSGIITPGI